MSLNPKPSPSVTRFFETYETLSEIIRSFPTKIGDAMA